MKAENLLSFRWTTPNQKESTETQKILLWEMEMAMSILYVRIYKGYSK